MTSENIAKCITKFAIPCILERIIQNLYPLLDSLVVGKVLNLDSLSAIGIAASLYSLFNETFIGLVSGFSLIASKKFGAQNKKAVATVFYNSLILSVVICGLVSVAGIVLSKQMLLWLKTPASLMQCAQDYIFVLFLGLVLNMLYNLICEMLRAIGNSKMPLVLLVISTVIHLTVLYPLTKCFGVRGTAWTLVLSYAVAILLGAVYIHKNVRDFAFSAENLRIGFKLLKECLSIGVPMALRNFVVMIGVLVLGVVTNNIGIDYIAAYSVASKTGYVLTTPIFGFASAIGVFVSQNFGARNYQRIEKGVSFSLKTVMIINGCVFVLVLVAAKTFLRFALNGNETAIRAGFLYLCIRFSSTIFLTPAAIYTSILPAIGKPLFSTISGFFEIGVRFLFPLLLSQVLGFAVVPLTDTFVWFMLTVLLFFPYRHEFKKLKNAENLKDVTVSAVKDC